MNTLIAIVSRTLETSDFITLFLDALLKSFAILALAGVAGGLLHRASANARHWIWFLAVACLPCLPLLSTLLPSWQKPLWAVSTGFNSGNQISLTLQLAPTRPNATSPREASAPTPAASATSPHVTPNREPLAAKFSNFWVAIVFAIWIGGVLWNLMRIATSQLRLRSLARQSQPVTDAEWLTLLRELCRELDLRRSVALRQAAGDVMPLTWGWWRPIVLLPAEAGRWPAARRRIVLLHELAHVKRWDCFTQIITRLVCAFYWFNPLVWFAARRMRIEREQAADDLVLNGGCKASEYATQLVEIAATFRPMPQVAAIAMARSSKLEGRVTAILDGSRRRRPLHPVMLAGCCAGVLAMVGCIAAQKPEIQPHDAKESRMLHQQHIARMQAFAKDKERQALVLAAKDNIEISPEYRRFLDAAIRGDGQTVTNMYASFLWRHPQFGKDPAREDEKLRTRYWSPIHELCLAYDRVMNTEPKYLQLVVDEKMKSIPRGAIYFGGTDPGRALPTAFSKSHVDGDPFFTLTQNAMADGTYLVYLRDMYEGRIYTPTAEDSQNCFNEYLADAQRRLKENKLKPGEDVKVQADQRVVVQGQVAVMAINALITKIIFDKNPDREFYLEESFPLDWMYPYLEPHGLIMKINRQPLGAISDEVVRRDREYWSQLVSGILGDWLATETPVSTITEFVEKTYGRGDLRGFKGDVRFVLNADAQRNFSKLRSSIGGVYFWRAQQATDPAEKARMTREADFSFRQAYALCPYSPEACFRYVNLLVGGPQTGSDARLADAVSIAETTANQPAMKGADGNQVRALVGRLKELQSQNLPAKNSPPK